MCSYLCPCEETKYAEWLTLDDDYLFSFNRTKLLPSGTGNDADWRWDYQNYNRLVGYSVYDVVAPNRPRYFQNFTQCAKYLISEKEAARKKDDYNTTIYYYMPYEHMISAGVALLSYFERKYSCSGVC